MSAGNHTRATFSYAHFGARAVVRLHIRGAAGACLVERSQPRRGLGAHHLTRAEHQQQQHHLSLEGGG
jgi:hypothetical protein